ncbi:MAG: hypothetical protein J7K87_00960 [Candidatus Aenigmarchaeota archaeon]|nr:hypothetical protein [Candidatus Aenigmarchaeota archaeon]
MVDPPQAPRIFKKLSLIIRRRMKLNMDWKFVKDFIRPDWRKGIVFTAILLFSVTGMIYGRTMEVFFLIHLVSYMQIGAFFGVILYLLVLVVYWQIISCLIVYTYDLIRGKKEFRKEILIFLIIFITIFSISII